ncbi:sterol-sensing domain of SREBP cleavage-activation-domain-containing protein [Geopyxis carbonaria]|nr:sterol-sensing domain of SREBP cleavage-activation-domain-containing protein [Geopyxis carbonaria]
MSPRHPTLPRIRWLSPATLFLLFAFVLVASGSDVSASRDGPITKVHKAGYCSMRGQEKKSFFGGYMPTPDNGAAEDVTPKVRAQLVELCGDKWKEGPVCCNGDQIETLSSNLKRAESMIASCPACKANFFNLFCSFTCSPNQSLFVNITGVEQTSSGKDVVEEVDYFVSQTYAEGFYNSCKDVKFSATNGYVMDLIGGGAKNAKDFLSFLGRKSPTFGSPFQINFPPKSDLGGNMKEMHDSPKKCNDEDVAYRCACLDCPGVCPILPGVDEKENCRVGMLPCWSFSVIIIYSAFLIGGGIVLLYHAFQKHRERKIERLRLLQDSAPSDDEDEGDVLIAGYMDRPAREYSINSYLDSMFYHIGRASAKFPAATIGVSIIFVGIMSLGWLNFSVETNPVRLWVSPTSDAAMEKQFFDDNFGPFYRTQQAFLINDTAEVDSSPVMSWETLGWWFDVEQRISRLKSIEYGVTLEDVCLNPTGNGCVVQSVTGYFQHEFRKLKPDTWKSQIRACAGNPAMCLPEFGQPIKKEMVFGGFQDSGDIINSRALLTTWVLENHDEDSEAVKRSMDYEQSLKSALIMAKEEAKDRGLRLSFSTEISLEEELNKSTNTDAKIIIISYIAMFFYASIALGSSTLAVRNLLTQPGKLLVDSKFTLGVSGILIVLMSVSASIGIFSAMGVKVTLIIAEVIPFLVLAVGVDNIFLIVHEFERANSSHPDESIEEKIGNAMGRMGPSILLSATSETVAFALGAVVTMPAVRNFAIYAAGAVLINAVLQVTMFVSVLALNQKRADAGRIDCFPCLRAPGNANGDTMSDEGGLTGRIEGHRVATGFGAEEEGILQKIIRKQYAPFLLQKQTKVVVVAVFLGIFTASLALLPNVELGLDQRIAIPQGSYLIDYFDDLYEYFSVGPPVYFVTKDLNMTARGPQQSVCGRFSTCDPLSLSNILEQERKRPNISYIAEPAASWVDDFMLWLNPSLDRCCRVKKNNPIELCSDRDLDFKCKMCFDDRDDAWNITLSGMPEGEEFLDYLKIWMQAPTGGECPIAGKAAYSSAIVPDYNNTMVKASHFRTSHTSMSSQKDFIEAYAAARRIADDISRTTGTQVFPYSKFYIFFDQYSTIVRLTAALISAALGCILVVSSILLGSLKTGFVVSATVAMIVIDILGVMALWGVSLNAVSLVNLVICVGIGVEFCSHIARAFMFPARSVVERAKVKFRGRDARAWSALVNVGGSVFSGITVTKLIGVCVLAFTRSKIFEIYYFRIWLTLVIVAASHALIFLPVFLSLAGGDGYMPEDAFGLEADLHTRRALIPAVYDDSSDDE